ncbi:MAG: type II toxin-antitoxin system prevent-host-death family antitoxin [Balneolaceae bacterium]|nr:MAG: type II toxin-antitoxin system prevent-host-death family antitoxin [Balneolaceae bacterium]
MKTINIHQAKTHLSELIQDVLNGEEIIIAKYGTPLVRLEPYEPGVRRKPGYWKGKVKIASDFDQLPEELDAAFRGEAP